MPIGQYGGTLSHRLPNTGRSGDTIIIMVRKLSLTDRIAKPSLLRRASATRVGVIVSLLQQSAPRRKPGASSPLFSRISASSRSGRVLPSSEAWIFAESHVRPLKVKGARSEIVFSRLLADARDWNADAA